MSRWRVFEYNPIDLTVVIGHECPGAHTPYTEKLSMETAGFPRHDLGEKPTRACLLCSVLRNRGDPHLPGPADFRRDLEEGEHAIREKMYERWKSS